MSQRGLARASSPLHSVCKPLPDGADRHMHVADWRCTRFEHVLRDSPVVRSKGFLPEVCWYRKARARNNCVAAKRRLRRSGGQLLLLCLHAPCAPLSDVKDVANDMACW